MSSLKHLICVSAVLGGALLLNGCTGVHTGPSVPSTSSNEKIAFVRPKGSSLSDPRARGTIWIADDDGKNERQLTQSAGNLAPGGDDQPALSSVGIAFVRNQQLWLMNTDGTNARQLTSKTGANALNAVADPAWKPGNAEITFAGQRLQELKVHIFSLRLSDNSITQLTGTSPNPDTSINPPETPGTTRTFESTATASNEFDPEWSPDGTQLVFATDRHYRLTPGFGGAGQKTVTDLYKINYSAGGALTRLTRNVGGAPVSSTVFSSSTGNPVVSPGGTKVVFESGGGRTIYSIPLNATALTPDKWTAISTANPSDDTNPTYSPGGKFIALSRRGDIYSLLDAPASNGSSARLVIKHGVQPSWGRVVTATPTTRPTTAPTTRPTTTPTTRPTTTPTTRPTTTPTTRPTTGTTQSTNLSPQETQSVKRVSSSQVDVFNGIAITGDHEVDGSGVIQAFGQYPLNAIPAGATIRSAQLNLLQASTTTAIDGDPFGTLGALYVEGTALPTLNEGALASDPVMVSNAPKGFLSANVTAQVQKAVNARNSQFLARLRFQRPRNNNGRNDNYELQFAGLEITYTR